MLAEGRPILYIEDNPDDRFLFERVWRRAEIRNPLRTLENGSQALDYLLGKGAYDDRARHPLPGLVLLDIKMPGLSGFDVLRRVREDERLRPLPVLMLTASTSPQDVAQSYRLGANSFFVKPSSVQELLEFLKALKSCWLGSCEFPDL